jgi:hypothetical protein
LRGEDGTTGEPRLPESSQAGHHTDEGAGFWAALACPNLTAVAIHEQLTSLAPLESRQWKSMLEDEWQADRHSACFFLHQFVSSAAAVVSRAARIRTANPIDPINRAHRVGTKLLEVIRDRV